MLIKLWIILMILFETLTKETPVLEVRLYFPVEFLTNLFLTDLKKEEVLNASGYFFSLTASDTV